MNFKQNACVDKTLFRLLMALLLAALLAGCGGNRNLNKLPDILSSYEAALRWNGARAAMAFVSPDNHPAERDMVFILKRFEQVKINGYQVLSQEPGTSEFEYIQLVEILVENRHTKQLRSVRDRQRWQYDPDDERWWLVSGIPDLSRS